MVRVCALVAALASFACARREVAWATPNEDELPRDSLLAVAEQFWTAALLQDSAQMARLSIGVGPYEWARGMMVSAPKNWAAIP